MFFDIIFSNDERDAATSATDDCLVCKVVSYDVMYGCLTEEVIDYDFEK